MLVTGLAHAIDFRTGDRVIISDTDTIGADLFVGAQYLDVRGYVDGDIYAGCERITIDGDVRDDIRAAGREIVVRGNTGDGVIAFGQTVLIDGSVRGDVIAYGGEVRVTGRIEGSLYIGCGAFYLDGGQIGGKIDGAADVSELNGSVAGPVKLKGRRVTFGDTYRADKGTYLVLSREPGAEMDANAPEYLEVKVVPPEPFYRTMFFYWAFVAAFVFGLIIILLFKNFMQNYVDFAASQIGHNFGIGFLILIATPIAVVILLMLILTIPTALVLAVMYIFMLYIAGIFVAVLLGDQIQKLFYSKGARQPILSLLIGLIITTLLAEVPYAGWFFSLLIVCYGTGSLSRYVWGFRKKVIKPRK
jgi:hypothetical protein